MNIVYTYLCHDGFWRTRCGRHIAKRPKSLAPVFFPPDHPGKPVPEHTEFVKGEKTAVKKLPVFVREKQGSCVECRP